MRTPITSPIVVRLRIVWIRSRPGPRRRRGSCLGQLVEGELGGRPSFKMYDEVEVGTDCSEGSGVGGHEEILAPLGLSDVRLRFAHGGSQIGLGEAERLADRGEARAVEVDVVPHAGDDSIDAGIIDRFGVVVEATNASLASLVIVVVPRAVAVGG